MKNRCTVKAVCVSEKKGTPKTEVSRALLIRDFGIKGDAHGGKGHRQVSLLAGESIEKFREELTAAGAAGDIIRNGSFGENIVTCGIDLTSLPAGSRLKIGGAELEITQIGKECHSGCIIGKTAGRCIMPEKGVFARVTAGGEVKAGDAVSVISRM